MASLTEVMIRNTWPVTDTVLANGGCLFLRLYPHKARQINALPACPHQA
jgi:hypothetical protein